MTIIIKNRNNVRRPQRLRAVFDKQGGGIAYVTRDGEYFMHESQAKKHAAKIGGTVTEEKAKA